LAQWDWRSALLMLMPVRSARTEAGSSAAGVRRAVLRPAWAILLDLAQQHGAPTLDAEAQRPTSLLHSTQHNRPD
jgi:hypothetical protein